MNCRPCVRSFFHSPAASSRSPSATAPIEPTIVKIPGFAPRERTRNTEKPFSGL
jgi:hypothetical protein